MRACSSVDRALVSGTRGRRFESAQACQLFNKLAFLCHPFRCMLGACSDWFPLGTPVGACLRGIRSEWEDPLLFCQWNQTSYRVKGTK